MAGRKKTSVHEIRQRIHALRGILKRMPGGKSFAEEMAEHKREEKELEENKLRRMAAS